MGSDIDEDIFYAQIIFVGILAGGLFRLRCGAAHEHLQHPYQSCS